MIEFKKIIIEGFCSIGTLELPLNNNGITIIKGANGLGKTTIFSALVWVLYGKTLKGISVPFLGSVVPVLVRQVALPQNDHRRHWQDEEHHGAQQFIAEQQHDMCPQCTARKAANGCKDAHLQVHCTVFEKVDCGKSGAAGGAEFVGSIGVVGRQPGKQIGRQADKATASGCRIHKACKARHQNEKRHHPWRECDPHCYDSLYFSSFLFFARAFQDRNSRPSQAST